MIRRPLSLQIMTLLLYGRYAYVTVAGDGQVHLLLGPFARLLRLRNDRLKGHLTWLAEKQYISGLTFGRSYATFYIASPALLEEIQAKRNSTPESNHEEK